MFYFFLNLIYTYCAKAVGLQNDIAKANDIRALHE